MVRHSPHLESMRVHGHPWPGRSFFPGDIDRPSRTTRLAVNRSTLPGHRCAVSDRHERGRQVTEEQFTAPVVDLPTSADAGSVSTMLSGRRTRIILHGEIDVALSGELTDALHEAEQAGVPVDVDARHVTFMDSSGVSLLARLASHTPGRLRIIRPPEVVRFLLEVTRIGDAVDVVEIDPGFGDDGPEPAGPPPIVA